VQDDCQVKKQTNQKLATENTEDSEGWKQGFLRALWDLCG